MDGNPRKKPEFAPGLSLALKFALREMRGGLSGFYIFLGCILLGVAAISGVNSVSYSISDGISRQGAAILGGDISFSVVQIGLGPDQEAFLQENGELAKVVTMRAMARKTDGSDQSLIELKSVDDAYPLYGELQVDGIPYTGAGISAQEAIVDLLLLDRLQLETGDEISIGARSFRIAGAITSEPDRASEGLGFGPKVIVSEAGLESSGLVQPGSLLRYHYKARLFDRSEDAPATLEREARSRFPDSGWRIRTRTNAAPALSRSVERFSQFLTLVGLTALVVGGVGVANAVRAYLESKRSVIASLKSLGASGSFVFKLYLLQILLLTGVGIVLGLALGALMPLGAAYALADLLPVSDDRLFFPRALLPGAVYGLLTALAFAIWPLAIARNVQPTDLFRTSTYGGAGKWPAAGYMIALAAIVATLVFMAIYLAESRFIASVFVAAIALSFLALRLISFAIQYAAARVNVKNRPELKMAIANIHRPGSLTPSVTLSLGLGLALLVALATIDSNLRHQISDNIPDQAPDFFFVDIQDGEIEPFREKLQELAPQGKIVSVPMLRGRITSLRGIPARDFKPAEGGEWVLRGDRGITYAWNVPENSTLAEGEWWPEGYSGPPLVSFTAEEAGELGLNIGDTIVVNALGRSVSAKIASLRKVEWETLGINFVMVFSPNTFAGAPHSHLATLMSGKGEKKPDDGELLRELARTFPAVTSVRIRDALDTVNHLVGQLSTAIRAAASVALIASVLVLAGALAAGNRERVHDAVVLKTLGATRKRLMRMLVLEYTMLGAATAVFAILAGSIAAWFVVSQIMDFEFALTPLIAVTTIIIAISVTIGLGLAGTWHILGQKAAPVLREL